MSQFPVRLPSLDLIRGFVAVGRRMSITLAAQDLFLTQSAVSRQIRTLEEAIGVKLLNRGYRSISFTSEGERLFRIADNVVQQLQDTASSLASPHERVPVTITASIGVAALWILPRLGDFKKQYPDIDMRVAATNKFSNLKVEGADLAIRCCTAEHVPQNSLRLFGESVVPVCNAYLRIDKLDAATIAEHVLIELDDPRQPWLRWADQLNAMGLGSAKPKGILRFNQYDQVILSALAGQGIALGRVGLINPLLADNRLKALSSRSEKSNHTAGYAYWLIQAEAAPRNDVLDVINWIKTEARHVDPHLDGESSILESSRTA